MNFAEEIEKHKPPDAEQKKFSEMTNKDFMEWRAKRMSKLDRSEFEVVEIGEDKYIMWRDKK